MWLINVPDVISATRRNTWPCSASGPPRRGRVITHQRRRRAVRNHDKDALTAHFQRLSMIKPRISSRFTYSDRLSKATRIGPRTVRASCLDSRMREKRTYTVSGVILARNGRKDFPLGLCNHEQRDVRTSTTLAKVHQCPGSLGLSSRSPRALSIYVLPVWHIRRVTLLHYMQKILQTFYFFIRKAL